MSVFRGSRELATVFGTMGFDENSATAALGWTLCQSPTFAKAFLHDIFGAKVEIEGLKIDLQRYGTNDGGYTDIELSAGADFHLIIEAKVGWVIPTSEQLAKYATRIDPIISRYTKILSLTAMGRQYVDLPLEIGGISTEHRSWEDVVRLAHQSKTQTRSVTERLWLSQLITHLDGFMQTQDILSSLVYLVPLNKENIIEGSDYCWADVVYKEQPPRYFHPVGGVKYARFPKTPQSYIGFRIDGKVKSVHFVTQCEVVVNLNKINKNWPEGDDPVFLYTLGPPMLPAAEIRSGAIYAPGSNICAIDTLLSGAFETVADAVKETDRRRALMRLGN